ncbi:universal stress protein [Planotetraspora kaengkrachanensis]|uniref:Universal stress protein n=1 Tax=Planotetraspora kaengkrachanensis TaxID=575193 RepID=A0A8J3LVN9_9ACTN|nr:universal stress protein [Planotetraspora kaengkrachanensis]GIG78629.1 universal stress protein [Planotetraspora kaengkrachanensis]
MIIVGVDGSQAGLEAAGWGSREAALRGVPLKVVYALPEWAFKRAVKKSHEQIAEWMRDSGTQVVMAGVERARREAPDVEVDHALLAGDPRSALIQAAGDADLLVVGNHGLGGFRGLLLGSVAHGVAGHASCDVVVVRQPASPPRGEVVVGVDGSPEGAAILEFAFAEAALRGAGLRAVRAWSLWMWSAGGAVVPMMDPADDERIGIRLLEEALVEHRKRHPEVEVTEDVVQGHPADVLRRASEGADLLVVGSHGAGEFAGLVLGSISQAMLHHARCPLAVVRAPKR